MSGGPSVHASALSSPLPFMPTQPGPGPLTTVAGVGALDLPPELLPLIIPHLPFCSLGETGGRGSPMVSGGLAAFPHN